MRGWLGKTDFEQADESGLIHRVESRDFLVRTADLDLGAGLILPRAGDQVRETVGTIAGSVNYDFAELLDRAKEPS